jgi:Na+/melibiose symporter-like transporter
MKEPRSHLVLAGLASGALYFAANLSRGDRGIVDWIVLSLFGVAILWNLFRLGQRLHRHGGRRDLWHMQRTVLFWILGLLNTLFARPENVGSWKYWVGLGFVVVAAVDSFFVYRKERAAMEAVTGRGDPPDAAAPAPPTAQGDRHA